MDEIVISPKELRENGSIPHVFYVAITAEHSWIDASYAFIVKFLSS
jgi:hypothetical protein